MPRKSHASDITFARPKKGHRQFPKGWWGKYKSWWGNCPPHGKNAISVQFNAKFAVLNGF